MGAERTGRLWDEVRRALGRVASRVTTHGLPAADQAIAVALTRSGATDPPTVGTGRGEQFWRPAAQIERLPLPESREGGGGVDLAGWATVIRIDGAYGTCEAAVLSPSWVLRNGDTRVWNLALARLHVPHVRHETTRLAAQTVTEPMRFQPPRLEKLAFSPLTLATESPVRDTWQLEPAPSRSALSAVGRVAISRPRLEPPPGVTMEECFEEEHRALAQTLTVPEGDVQLIGVFPQVPLSAVLRLSLAQDGSTLQVWLKPDSLGLGRTASVRSATLALGKQRSTGKALQAVMRPAGRDERSR